MTPKQAPITKVWESFTHHRGILLAGTKWVQRQVYDRWHMKGGEIVHQKFTANRRALRGHFDLTNPLERRSRKPMIVEERTMSFRPGAAPADCWSISRPCSKHRTRCDPGWDPEHAGVQFRPANEVVAKETVYVFPKENADPARTRTTLGGRTFTLQGKRHRWCNSIIRTIPRTPSFRPTGLWPVRGLFQTPSSRARP